MDRKSPAQFSLLEMLLGFALLTTLEASLLAFLRLERWGTNLNFFLWLTIILLLLAGMRWAMLRGTPPQADGWWWIGSASLIVLLPSMLERLAYYRVIGIDGVLGGFLFVGIYSLIDTIGGSLYLILAKSRPRQFPVVFHLIVMASLFIFSVYISMKIMRSLG